MTHDSTFSIRIPMDLERRLHGLRTRIPTGRKAIALDAGPAIAQTRRRRVFALQLCDYNRALLNSGQADKETVPPILASGDHFSGQRRPLSTKAADLAQKAGDRMG